MVQPSLSLPWCTSGTVQGGLAAVRDRDPTNLPGVPTMLPSLIIGILLLTEGVRAKCLFPSFLQDPLPDGSTRYWLTEIKYTGNSEKTTSRLEITSKNSQLEAWVNIQEPCDNPQGSRSYCDHKQLEYTRQCLKEDGVGKYRVRHQQHNLVYYFCMKIVLRNRNLVQVWHGLEISSTSTGYRTCVSRRGRKGGVQDGGLCNDRGMEQDPWPWVAPKQEEWVPCPLAGGYDFTMIKENGKRICPDTWRLSRMESECVRGEGLQLTFPDHTCSPFDDAKTEVQLQCWGSWLEDGFTFLVAGNVNRVPQFVFPMSI
ncbi:hypothetical protein CAPTEDRAFT_225694 [Capitella teleta]|uniref:DUF7042 domain-containing protein n=1 Tax=Capitella teleta TaxID=283909 RepID=R7URP8_CAPTE|nr:hypothetical protein CAPTEDRAFT_225694 [Capitella teleta]|eukprot:ELU08885.1 hypothetical protein CAPTEDRAFT_225694 [Capitella teleta]